MKFKALFISSLAGLSVLAQAHPGHDHNDISTLPIHFAYYGGIAVIIALAGYVAYHMRKKNVKKSNHNNSQ